jgi:hypothetical protein
MEAQTQATMGELATVGIAKVPLRVLDVDDALHFSHLKKIAKSAQQYLHAVNTPFEPTAAMLLGTAVHTIVLGARPGKPVLRFGGDRRGTNEWKLFKAANPAAEILTAPEWTVAEEVAASVLSDPVAVARLAGGRYEVPLVWEDNGIRCSTSGVDIFTTAPCALGDLKTTTTVEPESWARLAFKMGYPMQLAWYRRGARANGIEVPGGLFLLGVETVAPYEIVDLDLTEEMIDLADKTVSLWLERLRINIAACPRPMLVKDWPGYAQSRVPFDLPSWMRNDEES